MAEGTKPGGFPRDYQKLKDRVRELELRSPEAFSEFYVDDPQSVIPYLSTDWYPAFDISDPAAAGDMYGGSPHFWEEGGWTCLGGGVYYSPAGAPPTAPGSVFRCIDFFDLPDPYQHGTGSDDPPHTILNFEVYDVGSLSSTYDGNGGVDLQYLNVQGARWQYELNPDDAFSQAFLPNESYFQPVNSSNVKTAGTTRRTHTGTSGQGMPPFEVVLSLDGNRYRNRRHVHQTFFGQTIWTP